MGKAIRWLKGLFGIKLKDIEIEEKAGEKKGQAIIGSSGRVKEFYANLLPTVDQPISVAVDTGHIIYHQVISFLEQKEPKVKLSFPSTIYGLLLSQGFKPYPGEAMEKPTVRQIDSRAETMETLEDAIGHL
nr:protein IQ-DOMAIN 14-like [Ipomoea batatas]